MMARSEGWIWCDVDPALQDEIDQLKVELASRDLTVHSQADELHELYSEIERLRV
jgi:hypothetical protein